MDDDDYDEQLADDDVIDDVTTGRLMTCTGLVEMPRNVPPGEILNGRYNNNNHKIVAGAKQAERTTTTFDVLVCPLSVTERFLSQPLVCGTVFHRTSWLPPLSPSSVVVLNHISSHFLTLLLFVQCPRSGSSFWTL